MNRSAFFWMVMGSYQVLLLGVAWTVAWWLKPWLARPWRRMAAVLAWLGLNALLVSALLRIGPVGFKGGSMVLVGVFYAAVAALLGWAVFGVLTALKWPQRRAGLWARGVMPCWLLLWLVAGWWGAYMPTVVRYDLTIDKPLAQPLRILLVSDLHLGRWIGNGQLARLQRIVEQERPDVVLMAGDVMDDLPDVYRSENMGAALARIRAPLGVYATLGNHDNYRGVQADIVAELAAVGVTTLRDEAVRVDGRFWLVGRRDDTEGDRLPLRQLIHTDMAQEALPIVVLDHQPTQADANLHTAADIQLSGHTHNGQLWPGTWLVGAFQPYSYGHYRPNGRHLIVSSGYGLWGVPLRIGTRAEAVMVTVRGTAQ